MARLGTLVLSVAFAVDVLIKGAARAIGVTAVVGIAVASDPFALVVLILALGEFV